MCYVDDKIAKNIKDYVHINSYPLELIRMLIKTKNLYILMTYVIKYYLVAGESIKQTIFLLSWPLELKIRLCILNSGPENLSIQILPTELARRLNIQWQRTSANIHLFITNLHVRNSDWHETGHSGQYPTRD